MSEEEKKGKPQIPKNDIDNPIKPAQKGGTRGGKTTAGSNEIKENDSLA
jgi:hypothetical protein